MKVISIIPARGGSKGVLKKNIKLLAGKPLIHYTIDAARKSRYIDYIIVSTDDDEIASIVSTEGIIIVKRPSDLAADESPTIDAIFHALDKCSKQGLEPDVVILLQPTSPLRTAVDIDRSLELFFERDCDTIISVSESAHPPYWNMIFEDGYLQPLFSQESLTKRRQDFQKAYLPNGAIYIASPLILKQYRSFYAPKTKPYFMSQKDSLDLDTDIDFIVAEAIIQNKR